MAQSKVPVNRMQQFTWIGCSAAIGAFIGIQSAGPPCLKQLVSLQSSPMAAEARRLYVSLSIDLSIYPPIHLSTYLSVHH